MSASDSASSDAPPVPAARLPFGRAEPPAFSFTGFPDEAFEALGRLREEPHMERYQIEKAVLKRHVQTPFKRYRDDLVMNWVLPNALPFETERGVFSRFPKNDFGAGGANHHLWMSFYRPGRRRLSDIQLSHGVYPDGFAFGLYVGGYAKSLFTAARDRLLEEPERALEILNAMIGRGYRLKFAPRVKLPEDAVTFDEPLSKIPEGLDSAKGIWVRAKLPREEVQALGPQLVERALEAQADLWPLYRFLAEASGEPQPVEGPPGGSVTLPIPPGA